MEWDKLRRIRGQAGRCWTRDAYHSAAPEEAATSWVDGGLPEPAGERIEHHRSSKEQLAGQQRRKARRKHRVMSDVQRERESARAQLQEPLEQRYLLYYTRCIVRQCFMSESYFLWF